nr:uncharacterized protein LOC117222619 [Megalopta genalis]
MKQKLAKANNNSLVPNNGMNNHRATNHITSSSTIKDNTKILSRLNDTRLQKYPKSFNLSKSLKDQPLLLTPAKKRSSLDRPVRVYDSFSQPSKLVPVNYAAFQGPQRREIGESTTCVKNVQEETSWSIRLRKRKKLIRLMKQQQQNRSVYEDTDRLLRVFSVNNVDQDNRYNVSRCSVM